MSAARVLPREEWHRLPADQRELMSTMNAEDVRVVVVEKYGKIVARMAVMRIPHLESVWIDQGVVDIGTARALLRTALDVASGWAPLWIYANASTEEDGVRQILEQLGTWMPMHTFVIPLRREVEEACPISDQS